MAARGDDKAMAGLLRRSLAQDAGASGCPEPEILAAYFDHALDAQETARYDLHFSRCSLCREQLAAMARAGGAADTGAAEKKNAGAWAWLAGAGWLMPAAAALVALLAISGIALRMRKPAAPANSAPVTAPAPQTNSAPSPQAAPSSSAASYARNASHTDAAGAPVAPSESTSSRELGARLPSHTVSHANAATRGGELSRVGVMGGSTAKSAAAPVMQPQTPKPAPQASPAMTRGAMRTGNGGASGSGGGVVSGSGGEAAPAATNSTDQSVTVTEAAPPADVAEPSKILPEKKTEAYSAKSDAAVSVEAEAAPQPNARKTKTPASTSAAGKAGAAAPAQSAKAMNLAANQTMEAAALARLQQAQISSNLMNLQIQTPDPKILWMLTDAGAIEKSEDGGVTWKLEYLETHARIIAGSAPSMKICWLVGEGGTIVRTTNGSHWKTIKPPEETDFVRVEATDALTATVTALDGRRFSTSDGGKSWNSVN
jgi:hypothetical protein